jgi:hypothetical protein
MDILDAAGQEISRVKLGKTYKDSITGFEGVAVSRTEYLYSCVRVAIQPVTLHEGKPVDCYIFDEHQLVEVPVKVVPKAKAASAKPGGPGDVPKARSISQRR